MFRTIIQSNGAWEQEIARNVFTYQTETKNRRLEKTTYRGVHTLYQDFSGEKKNQRYKIGCTCGTHMNGKICRFVIGKREENIGLDVRIILKYFLNKQGEHVCIGFISL